MQMNANNQEFHPSYLTEKTHPYKKGDKVRLIKDMVTAVDETSWKLGTIGEVVHTGPTYASVRPNDPEKAITHFISGSEYTNLDWLEFYTEEVKS